MNGRLGAIGGLTVAVLLVVSGCGGDAAAPIASTNPAASAAVGSTPAASAAEASQAISPSAAASSIAVPGACTLTTPGELATVVGMRFNDGRDVTAELGGWTSACSWLQSVGAGEAAYAVNTRVLAEGTLVAFRTMAGATAVPGLADEAFVWDDGRQVAMRFGSVVVMVAGARDVDGGGVPASATGALARLIASRLGE